MLVCLCSRARARARIIFIILTNHLIIISNSISFPRYKPNLIIVKEIISNNCILRVNLHRCFVRFSSVTPTSRWLHINRLYGNTKPRPIDNIIRKQESFTPIWLFKILCLDAFHCTLNASLLSNVIGWIETQHANVLT
jgi:hypothetical protein